MSEIIETCVHFLHYLGLPFQIRGLLLLGHTTRRKHDLVLVARILDSRTRSEGQPNTRAVETILLLLVGLERHLQHGSIMQYFRPLLSYHLSF